MNNNKQFTTKTEYQYTPETLLPVYSELFNQLCRELDPRIAALLRPRRTVARHGTCNDVLVWTINDRRQRQATFNPQFFGYAINRDSVRFESHSTSTDWVLKLHMNTVRMYHKGAEIRNHLINRIPPVIPTGFRWNQHERFLCVEWGFDFSGPPYDLVPLVLPRLRQLIEATWPVLEKLIQEYGDAPDTRRASSADARYISHKRAAKTPGVPNARALNRAIPLAWRGTILARHSGRCALCGRSLTGES